MAERASQATKPSESDFHDSHPLDDEPSPTLGSLTDLDSLPDDDGDAKSMGDLNSVAADEDDVLGDITLLEEAFAEMGEDQEEETDSISDIAADLLEQAEQDIESEASIPVLNETVDEPTGDSEPAIASADIDQSIPVLEQQATTFSEAQSEPANVSDSALEQLLESESTNASSETAESQEGASVFMEPEEDIVSNFSQFKTAATSFAEISADDDVQTAVDVLSDSDIEDIDENQIAGETVDDKVAQFTADGSQSEINEIPLAATDDEDDITPSTADSYSEISTDFAEGLDSVPLSTAVSKFDDSQSASKPTHTEHQVSVGNSKSFTLNIPFELHSQLSKKIDELVIDATTSLTNELNDQLSNRLEVLLEQAVEAVLPVLVNQMVNGLRVEVKQKVKEQLPLIINDVLGKTSLKDK